MAAGRLLVRSAVVSLLTLVGSGLLTTWSPANASGFPPVITALTATPSKVKQVGGSSYISGSVSHAKTCTLKSTPPLVSGRRFCLVCVWPYIQRRGVFLAQYVYDGRFLQDQSLCDWIRGNDIDVGQGQGRARRRRDSSHIYVEEHNYVHVRDPRVLHSDRIGRPHPYHLRDG